MAWVVRFTNQSFNSKTTDELNANEVGFATRIICRHVQQEVFPHEYATLLNGKNVDQGGLFKFNPYLDEDAKPTVPILGQLPMDRLTPYHRPFAYTGLDYFGLLAVVEKSGGHFTCLSVRAIHLEIAANLSTHACLVCIGNLCNIRGVRALIRCDNGTN